VPDHRPPALTGDERTTVLELLQFQRESVVRKVEGVSDEDAARPATATGTSLLWLVQHLRRAELIWVLWRFAGQDVVVPDDAVRVDESVAESVAAYRAMWSDVDEVLAVSPDLDAPCANIGGLPQVNLRWVLMHLLEETARHAGHADILREALDGDVGR
jgi:hypothetical protein